jgi:peptide deformylase
MAILKIARMGHPILRQKAALIPPKDIASSDVQRLIEDMVETMRESDGAGLAANQVYVPRQLVVYEVGGEGRDKIPLTVLINPRIVSASRGTAEDWEGCLSIPEIRGRVPRATEVRVRALDRTGKEIEISAKDLEARVIQHETDHLAGVLFPDRMTSLATLTFLDEYARYWNKPAKQ